MPIYKKYPQFSGKCPQTRFTQFAVFLSFYLMFPYLPWPRLTYIRLSSLRFMCMYWTQGYWGREADIPIIPLETYSLAYGSEYDNLSLIKLWRMDKKRKTKSDWGLEKRCVRDFEDLKGWKLIHKGAKLMYFNLLSDYIYV